MHLGIMLPNALAPCESDTGEKQVSLKDLEELRKHGLGYAQARPEVFADGEMKLTRAGEEALESLDDFDITIVGWCSYKPLIGKPEVVEASVGAIERAIAFADEARQVSDRARAIACSESGAPANNPDLSYETMWKQITEAAGRIADAAEKHDALFAFEPTRSNILDGSANTCKLIGQVGSERIRVIFDPANIVGDKDTLEGAVARLRPYMVFAHAKDVILKGEGERPDYPLAGKGTLDYPCIFELLDPIENCNEIIIEYVRTPEQALEAIGFLRPFCS